MVGVELASLYALLGSTVALVESQSRLLASQDEELGIDLCSQLQSRGIEAHTSRAVVGIEASGGRLVARGEAGDEIASADLVVTAVGRRPNDSELELEARGVTFENGRVGIDEHCRTSVEGIYAVGDLAHGSGSAQLAILEGRRAVDHALGRERTSRSRHAPVYIQSTPPVAAVGLTESAARDAGHEVAVGRARFCDSASGRTPGPPEGFVKVVANATHGRLLGVHLLGAPAKELIGEAAAALALGATIAELADMVHPTPGYGQVLAAAADAARPSDRGVS